MKKSTACTIIGIAAILVFSCRAQVPSVNELQLQLRQNHPRLFINSDTLPAFKARLNGACADRIATLRKEVDRYPEKVELEYVTQLVDIIDGKMVFKRAVGDQNAVCYGLKKTGGVEALKCALVYLATGDKRYLQKANDYLQLSIQFIQLAQRSRILPEWYHYSRQCALIAYDWLFNDLSDAQKRAFIKPMIDYIDYMQYAHGYQVNGGGGTETGNYGESGLMWYAGLAAWRDGYCDDTAQSLLEHGYAQQCRMMDTRERMSAGTGLLLHITTGYTFGAYPWASCNFLHTLKSAANLDLTAHWTQMRDYPLYFAGMAIPNSKAWTGFCEYGWGDAGHTSNNLGTGLMYNHMAQVIHLYGKQFPEAAKRARAVQQMLPERDRKFQAMENHPYLPFILDGFDPAVKNSEPPETILGQQTAIHFPTFGLTNMRSGFTDNDTFASIKAGATSLQHQHYDENSFIIYKNGFQALDSGTRNNAPHHLVYYPQSIAHNTILIRMPNEPLASHWYPANAPRITQRPAADGGQNIRCKARSLGFDSSPYHAVTGGDATACYSAKKCREAVRQFVFIKPDYFIIYDRVTSITPDQQKVFLLHSQAEPRLVDGVWRSSIGDGALFTKTLLPQQAQTSVIGGKDNEYVAGGINYPLDSESWVAKSKGQTWAGQYRLEISPAQSTSQTRFLHVMQAANANVTAMVASRLITTDTSDGVVFSTADGAECTVLFKRDGDIGGSIAIRKNGTVLLERPLLTPQPVGPQQQEHVVFDNQNSARIDVYMSNGHLTEHDKGNTANLERPRWLNKGDSFCAHFTSSVPSGHFSIKATTDGILTVKLMGPDIRIDKIFQRYEVEYSSFSINGKPFLQAPVRTWHNAPKIINVPVKAGDVLKLNATFRVLGLAKAAR